VGSFSVEIAPAAVRQLKKLSPPDRVKVAQKIDYLVRNPRPDDARVLQGAPKGMELLRLRVGPQRIIYQIIEERLLVLVLRVAGRKEAYRQIGRLKIGSGSGPKTKEVS
jgi:mRNA interferase RelE/StbE